jgi:hypothetical protein
LDLYGAGKNLEEIFTSYKKSLKDRVLVLTNDINKGIIWERENVE